MYTIRTLAVAKPKLRIEKLQIGQSCASKHPLIDKDVRCTRLLLELTSDNKAKRDQGLTLVLTDYEETLIVQTQHLRDVATMPEPKMTVPKIFYVK